MLEEHECYVRQMVRAILEDNEQSPKLACEVLHTWLDNQEQACLRRRLDSMKEPPPLPRERIPS
jgi:hypothetical protein